MITTRDLATDELTCPYALSQSFLQFRVISEDPHYLVTIQDDLAAFQQIVYDTLERLILYLPRETLQ
jgi:hypothetical protein